MKIRLFLFFGAAIAVLLLTSCMTPSQQLAALEMLDRAERAGTITPEQYEELRQSILDAGTANFWQQLIGNVTSVGLAVLGIRWQRGPSASSEERVARRSRRR